MSNLTDLSPWLKRPAPLVLTSAQTLAPYGFYGLDTSGGAFDVTLPGNPNPGMLVGLTDVAGSWAENPPTVLRNGQLIMGLAENLVLDKNFASLQLMFVDSTNGWRII